MHAVDQAALNFALGQRGAFAAWQLGPSRIVRRVTARRLAAGAWIKKTHGVYALAGVPDTYEQRVWVAWLAVGAHAIVSHEVAAQIHTIPNVVRERLTLTVPHSGWHRQPGVFVHQISDVLPDHRTEVGGLPITTIPRTIVDLAAVSSRQRLLHIVEGSHDNRLVSYVAVGECLTSVSRRGKPGVQKLAWVLDYLDGDKAVSQSKLERSLLDLVDRARLVRPRPQFPHPGRMFTNGCVDFAYVAAKLIIEVDGRSWHTRIKQLKRDHERDAEAARHGWLTLRLLYEHVVGDPDGCAQLIADVMTQRLAQLA